VRLLLDTHIAIWFLEDPTRLDGEARDVLERSGTRSYVSAASVWETALKEAKGRISLPEPLDVGATRVGLLELPVTWAHARAAAALPTIHSDPFDRLLVAQAAAENLVLLTRDRRVAQYDVETMSA
jgi:PIN domain nuclease of toxin-antitoxin system